MTTLVIQGSTGTPNRHHSYRLPIGTLLAPLWELDFHQSRCGITHTGPIYIYIYIYIYGHICPYIGYICPYIWVYMAIYTIHSKICIWGVWTCILGVQTCILGIWTCIFGCLDLSFGCLDLYSGCLRLTAEIVTFISKPVILQTWRLHFNTLSDHFGDPGIHRDAQQAPFLSAPYWHPIGTTLGIRFPPEPLWHNPHRAHIYIYIYIYIWPYMPVYRLYMPIYMGIYGHIHYTL